MLEHYREATNKPTRAFITKFDKKNKSSMGDVLTSQKKTFRQLHTYF